MSGRGVRWVLAGGAVVAAALGSGFGLSGRDLGLSTTAQAAPALSLPPALAGQQLELRADELSVDLERGSAQLRGNVRARVPRKVSLEAAELEVTYTAEGVSRVVARGGVQARLTQLDARLEARAAELDLKSERLLLEGGVRVRQGKGWLKARRASVSLADGRLQLEQVHGSLPLDELPGVSVEANDADVGAP